VALVHVDLGLELWVDGRKVLQRRGEGYPEDHGTVKARMKEASSRSISIPAPEVRLGASGGQCELRHVRLYRDVYYTSPELDAVRGSPEYEYAARQGLTGGEPGWGTMGHKISLAAHKEDPDLAEYFVLGDNSPQSLDSRAWTAASPALRLKDERGEPTYKLGTVPRYNLIGRALFVYWPAGFRVPGLPGLPIVPNVGKMRFIR